MTTKEVLSKECSQCKQFKDTLTGFSCRSLVCKRCRANNIQHERYIERARSITREGKVPEELAKQLADVPNFKTRTGHAKAIYWFLSNHVKPERQLQLSQLFQFGYVDLYLEDIQVPVLFVNELNYSKVGILALDPTVTDYWVVWYGAKIPEHMYHYMRATGLEVHPGQERDTKSPVLYKSELHLQSPI